MILATWPSPFARAFADVLVASDAINTVVEMPPFECQAALLGGKVDIALVPTFEALRGNDLFDLLPGVGLVGSRSPSQVLAVSSPLDQISTVAFDPRYAQEVLLAQIILKESYGGTPTFAPVIPSVSVVERLANHSAALVAPEEVPPDAVVLDLGQEWLELTLRPMVWGLLAGRGGEVDVEFARRVRDHVGETIIAAADQDHGEPEFRFTLDGYAQAGLEELIQLMYFHGSLTDFPELPFVEVPEEENESAE